MFSISGLLPVWAADAPSQLVSSLVEDSAAGSRPMLELRRALREKSLDQKSLLQAELGGHLQKATDPAKIRKICAALAPAPLDSHVRIVLDRLGSQASELTTATLLEGLADLLNGRVQMTPDTQARLLSHLEGRLKNRALDSRSRDAALRATAALGAPGFDLLWKARQERGPGGLMDAYYTALADTCDVRALPVLREAISDGGTRQGARIEAVHGLGQIFMALRLRGQEIPAIEQIACAEVLYPFLADTTEDQLFEVAVRSLCRINPLQPDPFLRDALLRALQSRAPGRRAAALDALFASSGPVDEATFALVHGLATGEQDELVRTNAQAVLDKVAAETQLP